MAEPKKEKELEEVIKIEEDALHCGVIMPISPVDGYPEYHWNEVKKIIYETIKSIEEFEFEISLVSDAKEVTVIHNTIIHNIYKCQMVICDISSRNPNVMFELGIRLAFDKPVILIKDDLTEFCFDTQIIEHLVYPHTLRYGEINDFKERLKKKFIDTYTSSKTKNYSFFLEKIGPIKVTSLKKEFIGKDEIVISMLEDIKREIKYSRDVEMGSKLPKRLDELIKERNEIRYLIKGYIDSRYLEREEKMNLLDNKDEIEKVYRALNMDRYYPTINSFEYELKRIWDIL